MSLNVDPQCSPERVVVAHLPNQVSNLAVNTWAAGSGSAIATACTRGIFACASGSRFFGLDDVRVQERRVQSDSQTSGPQNELFVLEFHS
jgi:hypothetical protein